MADDSGDRGSASQIAPKSVAESQKLTDPTARNIIARLSLTDWITAFATFVIAVATVWNVFYVRAQVQAMRDSEPDTAKLVQANQDLATAAKTQAQNTGKLVDAATQSAGFARDSADAAKGQLDEMRSEQRAQIILAGWKATFPLAFKDGKAQLLMEFDLKNSGHSLAQYVDIHGLFYVNADNQVMRAQKKACNTPKKNFINGRTGFSVGPGDTFALPYGFNATADDVSKWTKSFAPVNNPAPLPMVVGCVVYVSEGVQHHTPFVFEVDKATPNLGPTAFDHINPKDGDIPAAEVTFLVPPWFAGKTD